MSIETFCPRCGPDVIVRDDGTCHCGALARGKHVEYIKKLRETITQSKTTIEKVICPVHGEDQDYMRIVNHKITIDKKYCLRCLTEVLDRIGVCQAQIVKIPVEELEPEEN